MKYLVINEVAGSGSTGKIAADICRQYQAAGNECVLAYGRSGAVDCDDIQLYRIGSEISVGLDAFRTRLFDTAGFNSRGATKKFLRWADGYDPDVVWLHNLHGYYMNVEMLFGWMKSRPEKIYKWTLHDCWAFTGHCVHFTYVKCTQWITHCGYEKCRQPGTYPATWFCGNARRNFERKRAAFTGVRNMTLITPSRWLADLVKQSFLKEYPVDVVYNTIDKNIFRPTPSDFRKRYGLEGKKIILGVACPWSERKGLNDFIRLSAVLDGNYVIVLVGLSPKQIKGIDRNCPNVIALPKTDSREDLAKIYSAADVFVNPSKEETFGMTTAEAASCGTACIVYKGTAGEEVVKEYGGKTVGQNIEELYEILTGGGVLAARRSLRFLPAADTAREEAA